MMQSLIGSGERRRCSNEAKTRNRLKFAGCRKLPNRSQSSVGRSSPYCGDMWRTYCCLTSFFPIVDTCLSCEDIAQQSCAMVRRWRCFASFLRPVFPASRVQHISDLHSKFALRPMCQSMVDIQSATAEIRRGIKKEDRRKKPHGKNIMSASATQGGHNKVWHTCSVTD